MNITEESDVITLLRLTEVEELVKDKLLDLSVPERYFSDVMLHIIDEARPNYPSRERARSRADLNISPNSLLYVEDTVTTFLNELTVDGLQSLNRSRR